MDTVLETTDIHTPDLRQWQEQMRRRYQAAHRSTPYDHRPWDRGFNPWEGDAA